MKRIRTPPRLTANNKGAVWLNQLRDCVESSNIVDGVGTRVVETTRGTSINVITGAGTGPAGDGTLQRGLLNSVEADHYVLDNVGSSGTVVVAKPYELQKTPFDGNTIAYVDENGSSYNASYAYTTGAATLRAVKRTVTVASYVETQTIVPIYKPGFHYVFYGTVANGTGVAAAPDFIDVNADGRAWAKSRTT